ncbi:MAG: hypothetical protein KUG77_10605 [Nannocystaceae bacterium]|nr:hypothetical protein [Nannocystaceae bacterium]
MRSSLLASCLIIVLHAGCNSETSDSGAFQTGTDGSIATTSSGDTTASSVDETGSSSNAASTSGAVDDSGGAIFDLGGGTGDVDLCGEPEDNPIYVFTRGLETDGATSIAAFDPATLTFTPVVAAIECDDLETDWGASSMGVDRNRRAWITWSALADGVDDPSYKRIDRVNLDTGACEADIAELPTTDNWGSPLGMAFVADDQTAASETLYFVDTGTYLCLLYTSDAADD